MHRPGADRAPPCTSPRPPSTAPRPDRTRSSTPPAQSYPSGHAAYAIAWVAVAVVLTRALPGLARPLAVVVAAIALAVAIGADAASTCARTTSPTSSAGSGWRAAIFALAGIVALVVGHLRHNGRRAMSNTEVTYLVAACSARLRPGRLGRRSSSCPPGRPTRGVWERMAAAVPQRSTSLAAFVGVGVGAAAPRSSGSGTASGLSRALTAWPALRDARVSARRLCHVQPAPRTPAGSTSRPWTAITDAVESGAGLPEVVRAAARALDASLVLTDRVGRGARRRRAVARRRARRCMADAAGVEVARAARRRRAGRHAAGARALRRDPPSPMVLRLVTDAGRLRGRAPARARARLRSRPSPRSCTTLLERDARRPRRDRRARRRARRRPRAPARAIVVVRAQLHVPAEDGLARARRSPSPSAARAPRVPPARSPRSLGAGRRRRAPRSWCCVPGERGRRAPARRRGACCASCRRGAARPHASRVGRSRVAADPADLHRAGNEALLAANVAEGDARDDGPRAGLRRHRRLPPAAAGDERGPGRAAALLRRDGRAARRLRRAVRDRPRADLETFLDADGNVAGTAQRLFTHRHTIRYRLERVRELSGLDVGSTDGREKLSLGLKAMRVLGIAARGGPASEQGAGGGRVPRRS